MEHQDAQSMRQKYENNNAIQKPDQISANSFIEKLTRQQAKRYHKKFAFERSQFQQCIPNPDPKRPNEMITVQLVKKIL